MLRGSDNKDRPGMRMVGVQCALHAMPYGQTLAHFALKVT